MGVPGVGQAIDNLMKWSVREEWGPCRDLVFGEHLDLILEELETTEEELGDLLGDGIDMVFGFMLEDFLTARFGEEADLNIIDDYLKRRGWREKVAARRYLEALRDSTPSLYEVTDLDPGRSMTVRDMVLGGDPVTVEEKRGSESAARWDRIAGRVVMVNKRPQLTGGVLLIPHQLADAILSEIDEVVKWMRKDLLKEARKTGSPAAIDDRELRKTVLSDSLFSRLVTQSWLIDAVDRALAPLPEMRNTDGDRILFSEIRFPIEGDAVKLAAILDGIDGFERHEAGEPSWAWVAPEQSPRGRSHGKSQGRQKELNLGSSDLAGRTTFGNAEIVGDMLVVRTNSAERAERARDLMAGRLGELVGRPLTAHQGLERLLEDGPASEPAQADLPPEIAEQVVQSYLDDHYRRTLDDPLPILDGKTPRQAARSKKGRARVVDWLKQLENAEYRRAARQGVKPYDTAWIWRELKLEEPGHGAAPAKVAARTE